MLLNDKALVHHFALVGIDDTIRSFNTSLQLLTDLHAKEAEEKQRASIMKAYNALVEARDGLVGLKERLKKNEGT